MIKPTTFLLPFFVLSLALNPVSADENHGHESEKEATSTSHDEHDDGDKHQEEENSAVGAEKGITEFSAEKGLRLSPEALKSFGIAVNPIAAKKNGFEIPRTALLEAQDGKYVYVENGGMLKRVTVEVEKRMADTTIIKSTALLPDSRIVISGVPFLRAAELDVTTGGGSHGH